jgi:hypothetical protein
MYSGNLQSTSCLYNATAVPIHPSMLLQNRLSSMFRNILADGVGKITSVDNVWDHLKTTVLRVCSDDLWTMAQDDLFFASPGFLYGNKRIGPLRIRQVRIPAASCNSYYLQSMLSTSDQPLAR